MIHALQPQVVASRASLMRRFYWVGSDRGIGHATKPKPDRSLHELMDIASSFINLCVMLGRPLMIRWTHPGSGRSYNTYFNPPKVPGKDDVSISRTQPLAPTYHVDAAE